MSDTPSDVFHEILLRVPPEPLLRFRAVCKAWRRIIDNPSFVKAHTDNQLISTNFIIRSCNGGLQSLSLDSIDFADGCQTVEVSSVKQLIRLGVPRTPELPVPSCNGLMLLYVSHVDPKMSWVIWNPFTRDFHRLSALDVFDTRLLGIGLGYDSVTADYKVVRVEELYGSEPSVFRTMVYSLKLDSWKMIKNCPYCFSWDKHGIFLNGSLYWRSDDMIIALDLVNEDYYQLPLPQELAERESPPFYVYLDAFSGNLVLSYYHTEVRFVGWVMEDCKVERSWRKLFSFDAIVPMESLRPLAYLKNKGHVVLHHWGKFFLLDIEKNSAKKISIAGLPHYYTSQNCVKSILKLDESYDVCRRVATERTRAQRKKANASATQPATITDAWCRSDSDYNSDSIDAEDSVG